jgi:tetraacyldisaccharide 4'-kinase
MRAPTFWQKRGAAAISLAPLGALYALAGTLRRRWSTPERARVPVICVGNLVAGGAGKTPAALALIDLITAHGGRPHLLTRGYGGSLAGPAAVNPAAHDAASVGDEALLLAAHAPTWVARDRRAGARAAVAAGAGIIVMDDGLQNPTLHHDCDIVVVDGGYGFGNGLVMPAGPLREPIAAGLERARLVIVVGADEHDFCRALGARTTVVTARLMPRAGSERWRGRRVLAFAGIGRPAKFFATLTDLGTELVAGVEFSDHHPYKVAEIDALRTRAGQLRAELVTTEKDWVRLPPALRREIGVLPVSLVWDGDGAAVIAEILAPFFPIAERV